MREKGHNIYFDFQIQREPNRQWKQFGASTLKPEALFMIIVRSSILDVRKRKNFIRQDIWLIKKPHPSLCYDQLPLPNHENRRRLEVVSTRKKGRARRSLARARSSFRPLRKSPNSYHWTKQALLQEPLILPLSQRPTIIQVFLPSRILLMVDVFPLKNFPRKQTLIGNGGNSGGGGGRYEKREEQITFHHNFKYGKTKRGNWLLL